VIAETPLGAGIGDRTTGEIESWGQAHQQSLSATLSAIGTPGGPALGSKAAKLIANAVDILGALREIADTATLTELFDAVVDRTGFSAYYEVGDPSLADRWDNVLQLRGQLESYDVLPPEERLPTFLEEVALVSDADTMTEERDRVTLITLHAVKGLEFPVVFVAGVEEGLIPHQRSILERPEMLEEERRLFYVGITRAKERLYLTFAQQRNRYGSSSPSVPSSFLNSIPAEVLEQPNARRSSRRELRESPASVPVPIELPSSPAFEVGDEVFHPRFGQGRITNVVQAAQDQELAIDFKLHGAKRLLASMANLTIIADEGEETGE
jgi:DNA helicase-2/ATP-dependent DNA helicase PcrA